MAYAGAVKLPPDNDPDVPQGEQVKLGLEFQMSDLNQRVEIDALIPELHDKLTAILPEDDVLGIEFKPSKRFARKCIIVFANELAKDKVRIQGLSVFGKNVELSNPGQGVIKVEISNVSLLVPDDVIKNWLASQVGGLDNIVQFRKDHYVIRGQKRKWVSDIRFAWVKNLTVPLPPAAKFRYGSRDTSINIWHYGQTHMKCRFCYQVVPKGHDCPRKPQKQGCHKCGDLGHMIRDCPDTKQPKCHRCNGPHVTKDCTILVKKNGIGGRKYTVTGKSPESHPRSRANEPFLIPHLIDEAEKKLQKKNQEKAEREKQNQAAVAEQERLQKLAMEENQKLRDEEKAEEERNKRAEAAENRRSPAPASPAVTEQNLESDNEDMSIEDDEDEGEEEKPKNEEGEEVRPDDNGEEEESVNEDMSIEDIEGQDETSTGEESLEEDSSSKDKEDDSELEEGEGDLDSTKFFEALEDDRPGQQTAKVALVGGSNAPKIRLVSDDELLVSTVTLWEGGANIIQGANKVKEMSPDMRQEVELVILHLGTCDFPCVGTSSAMSHYMAYREITAQVSDLCPNAHIIMSGLLPQSGDDRELANGQLSCFNEALKATGEDDSEPNLHYCDNWGHFVSEEGHVLSELYTDSETFGVHVNDKGSEILSRSIMKCVKKVFYWERLGVSLDVSLLS